MGGGKEQLHYLRDQKKHQKIVQSCDARVCVHICRILYKFINEIFGNLLFEKLHIRKYFFSNKPKKMPKNVPVPI